MGGINQIINIYSNINRMTDQQKGYGLGIILGIGLHALVRCVRCARRGVVRRTDAPRRAAPLSTRIHLYIEINLIKTLILFGSKTIQVAVHHYTMLHSTRVTDAISGNVLCIDKTGTEW